MPIVAKIPLFQITECGTNFVKKRLKSSRKGLICTEKKGVGLHNSHAVKHSSSKVFIVFVTILAS
jgi:hypothetical protein